MSALAVTYEPTNKTLGAAIVPVVSALGAYARPLLRSFNIESVDPNAWYPQQDFLGMLDYITTSNDLIAFNLRDIWVNVRDNFSIPSGIHTLEQVLLRINDDYQRHHQDHTGRWDVHKNEYGQFVCVSTTPYPTDYEYGILYGLCSCFVPEGHVFNIDSMTDGSTTTYVITLYEF